MKKFRGVRDYLALEWLGQQNREGLRRVERVEMTFSIGVQERRAKRSKVKGVEGGKNTATVCDLVYKYPALAATWHGPGCEFRIDTFLLV